ncbi:MAG: 2-pyrone-4,6-dicarboxylate hydrolase, partial [Acetobacteraceae bacterium]
MDQPRPTFVLPPGSVECHSHVYDPDRFPYLDADLGERPHDWRAYKAALMDRLGFERVVVVQAAAYGPDNRATLEAVQRLGLER